MSTPRSRLILLVVCGALTLLVLQCSMYPDFAKLWKSCFQLTQLNDPFNFESYMLIDTRTSYANNYIILPQKHAFFWIPFFLLPFIPFAYVSLKMACYLFITLEVMTLFYSVCILGNIFPSLPKMKTLSFMELLFILTVIPVGIIMSAVLWGSPTWLMLIGLVGCLHYVSHETKRNDTLLGLFLYLLSIKIQITAPLVAAMLVWILKSKRYLVVTSLGAIVLISMGVVYGYRPSIFSDYYTALNQVDILAFVTASVPSILKLLVPSSLHPVVVFMPMMLLTLYGAWQGFVADAQRMKEYLCTVIPVAILFAPYSWGHDSILLLVTNVWIANVYFRYLRNESLSTRLCIILPVVIVSTVTLFLSLVFTLDHSYYVLYPLITAVVVYILTQKISLVTKNLQ